MIYLPNLAFKNKKTYERIRHLCFKIERRGEVSERSKWFGALYGKYIDHPFINDISIAWTGHEMEYGCFANRLIKKNEFIGEYTGLVRPYTLWTSNLNEYCFRYPLYKTFFFVYTIDAKMQGNETSFINHSNTPNCEAVALWHKGLYHMCLIALKDISINDQLFYDYGNKRFAK